jgi:hypothetical protein
VDASPSEESLAVEEESAKRVSKRRFYVLKSFDVDQYKFNVFEK